METLQEYREAMDQSTLFYQERVTTFFERAKIHFPTLKKCERFLVNNTLAFLGERERKVAKMFGISNPANVIRSRLDPQGPWVVRATGKGYDVIILCSGPYEAMDYLKFRGPIDAIRHTHAGTSGRPRDWTGDLAILKGAEKWLKANPWWEKHFS